MRFGQPGAGVGQRDAAAGDAGRAGPAVRLEHVAVDADGVLAEGHGGHGGAQRAADEALNLLGSAAGAVPLARGALHRGAGEHGVFGGDPALAAALLEAGHAGLDARGAVHQRAAHADEAGAFGVRVGAALQHERAQLMVGAAIRTRHGDAPRGRRSKIR